MATIKNSLKTIGSNLVIACKRFPVTILFITILTVFLIYDNHFNCNSEQIETFIIFYCSIGAVLSILLRICSEKIEKKSTILWVNIASHILWFASAYYIAINGLSTSDFLIILGVAVLIVTAIFILPFIKKKNDLPIYNFTSLILPKIVTSLGIGLILCLGLSTLTLVLNMLFVINIPETLYVDTIIICMLFISPFIFLQYIPEKDKMYNYEDIELSRIMNGVVHYLFIPLLMAYIVTLYAYLAKIIVEWSLPDGNVSWPISIMMLGAILIIHLLYPSNFHKEKNIDKIVTRWLPIVVIPLLFLMTISIIRRISDYGITINRLYLATFNVWCYIVCIGLILKSRNRIWWIPASFSIVLFIVSVGPQSIANTTLYTVKNDIKNVIEKSGIKDGFLTEESFLEWFGKQDKGTQDYLYSKIEYIRSNYGYSEINEITKGADLYTLMDYLYNEEIIETIISFNYNTDKTIDIPVGYSKFVKSDIVNIKNDSLDIISINITPRDTSYQNSIFTFKTTESELKKINEQDHNAAPMMLTNENDKLFIRKLTIEKSENKYIASEYTFDGLLFLK